MRTLTLTALAGIPEVRTGDDLATLVRAGLAASRLDLRDGDVIVLAQKIVSKSEGRTVALASVTPGARAIGLARLTGKDARLVELILRESVEVLRARRDVLIVEHRRGWIMANAGIDLSNVSQDGTLALLLPEDPDATCARLRASLGDIADIGVVINDSFGRAWRCGTTGTALGAAGVPALVDLRGRLDRNGRALQSTELGVADELAAAASLVMGQADEGCPAVLARGLPWPLRASSARELLRPRSLDLFR